MEKLIEEQRDAFDDLSRMIKMVRERRSKSKGYSTTVLNELNNNFDKVKKNHFDILKIAQETSLESKDIPYITEEIYYHYRELSFELKGELLDIIQTEGVIDPCTPPHSSTVYVQREDTILGAETRLPKIAVPTFSGDYLEWFSFRDLYTSLVHNNKSLNKIEKMFYLKGSVKGEAEHLIRHIFATEANYDLAWKTLEDRFHNKRIIVDTLLQKLFAIPKCSKPSHSAIKTLLDTTKECLSSLANLNIPTDNWDPMIVHLTVQKFDTETRKDWEHTLKASNELPELENLFQFLESTFRTLETLGTAEAAFKPKSMNGPSRSQLKTFSLNKSSLCLCCKKSHSLYSCWAFKSYSLEDKIKFVKSQSICMNCLSSGHKACDCKSSYTCQVCNQKHHTLLHNTSPSETTKNIIVKQSSSSLQNHHVSTLDAHQPQYLTNILLATLLLKIETPNGRVWARALLDQGSQGSFITEQFVQTYKLRCHSSHLKIHGVNPNQVNYARKSTYMRLYSNHDTFSVAVEAFILPNLSTYLPNRSISPLKITSSLPFNLADPQYFESRPIDIILGADVYGLILKEGQHKNENGLLFQETYFGWILSGPISSLNQEFTISTHFCKIDDQLRRFWEQEELTQKRVPTLEEVACENHFISNYKRDDKGRYIVSLPFKAEIEGKSIQDFEDSHIGASIRLRNMEKTFERKPELYKEYSRFMDEYLHLGHMQLVGEYPHDVKENAYYLPHHGVEKQSSTTTKLRVVFDGSSKYRNQRSLNEELAPGPALQCDLSQIILRWRRHKIALSSDIEKMFRQILIKPEHQWYQQILWRKSKNEPVQIYKLNTVTYGTTSAPFLSIRTLQQLARDEYNRYPDAADKLLTDIYVDDIMTGTDDVPEALALQQELCKLLNAGGFNLRKWASNSMDLLQLIPHELRESSDSVELNQDNFIKALGLYWKPYTDCFSFIVNFDTSSAPTKRSLLSDASKLFDPLGWLAPTTIIAKLLFQKLWLAGIKWDDLLPDNIRIEWMEYRNSLKYLEEVQIHRYIGISKQRKCSLHGFGDASQVGFAATVYSRTIMENGDIIIQLLQAKTKVAPLKTLSIPKLELCAAQLLAKLINKVSESLEGSIDEVILWSDSTTVLAWIRAQPIRWTVYVANRVAEIQRLTSISQWRYVPTKDNPADCATKGVMPRDLVNHDLWWHGPLWLRDVPASWPSDIDPAVNTNLEERKSVQVSNLVSKSYPDILVKYSTLRKTLIITSYLLRFHHNCLKKEDRRIGFISFQEIQMATNHLIRIAQRLDFSREIEEISNGCLQKGHAIANLCPFLDKTGILRVGGRLKLADIPASMKHPILLSNKNPLTFLIFSDAHVRTLHGGIQLMLNFVRCKYWVPNARHIAQNILKRCLVCFKYTAKTAEQLMGNLPSIRLKPARPFLHSGVDYAGPIDVRQSSLRNSKISKGYICIFLCMVTKAIHLEAVSSLSTEAFIAAFRRFVSRRGKCSQIYSDCGTNFVGADTALQKMHSKNTSALTKDLRELLVEEGTTWNFIPPASPHFGGLWEAGVKSTKHHLKRIMQDHVLNYEELATLLAEIEACLNSRPLSPLNEDVENCDALTPAHFLIGEPTINIPNEDLLDLKTTGNNRWRLIEQMKQHFWSRWRSEYLSRMQSRPKWATIRTNARIGDLVLLYDERCPPGKWPLARITEVHPGKDNLVRVVTLKCNGKFFKRPIRKICFLPNIDSHDSTRESDESNGTSAASRGAASQPGDSPITSIGLTPHP